jgi:hypothetical protein
MPSHSQDTNGMPILPRYEHLHLIQSRPTCLCDDNEVCPSIFYAGVIKCPVDNSTAIILDTLRPKITHAVTRFDSSQSTNARRPFGMSQQGTGENARPCPNPESQLEAGKSRSNASNSLDDFQRRFALGYLAANI